jgi:hypothetical protein
MRKKIKLNPVVAFQAATSSDGAAAEAPLSAKEEKEPETATRPLLPREGPWGWY